MEFVGLDAECMTDEDAEGSFVDIFQDWSSGDSGDAISRAQSRTIATPRNFTSPIIDEGGETERDYQKISTLIKELLDHAGAIESVQAIFNNILVPEVGFDTLTSVLERSAGTGRISHETRLGESVAVILHNLAQRNCFKTLHQATSPSIRRTEPNPSSQPPSNNTRKRKRDALEDDSNHAHRTLKSITRLESLQPLHEAIQRVLKAFQNNIIDKELIATIQVQLHQVFLFAVTSATGSAISAERRKVLNQIGKLVQLLGVLSGVQISVGDPSTRLNVVIDEKDGDIPNEVQSLKKQSLNASVFPCPHRDCLKIFSKLYDLRIHQRVHANKRPFKCSSCPASFTRSHDLHRHARGHTTKVYQCTVCMHAFSRRDAFKRHKENIKNAQCAVDAECEVVESQQGKKTVDRWSRRNGSDTAPQLEVGELSLQDLTQALDEMIQLYPLLQATVDDILARQGPSSEVAWEFDMSSLLPVTTSTGLQTTTGLLHVDTIPQSSFGMQETAPDVFAGPFPESDLSSIGLDLDQIFGINTLVHEASKVALTEAEQSRPGHDVFHHE